MKEDISFTCTNCQKESCGSYCCYCGQKRFYRNDFRFSKSIRDVLSEFFDLESTLGRTLKVLITSPGTLTADFLKGKQKNYVGPVKLYLIVIAVNFLVYSYLDEYSLVNVALLKSWSQSSTRFQAAIENAQVKSGQDVSTFYHLVNSKVNEILPVLLYLLIFSQALILKIQFRRYSRYYIEHLIFCLHFMAFGFLRDVALLPLQFVSSDISFAVSIGSTVVYLYFSLKKVYRLKGARLITNTLLHYAIFFLLFTSTIVCSVLLALSKT